MIYFDTAYLAKCYLNEDGSDQVRALAEEHEQVACCAFGRLELAAAFHRNFREGKITASQHHLILRQLETDEAGRLWNWLPLGWHLIRKTAAMFSKLDPAVYLRTADALHLVCASENGFREIYSNDKHLLVAGETAHIEVRDVIGGR